MSKAILSDLSLEMGEDIGCADIRVGKTIIRVGKTITLDTTDATLHSTTLILSREQLKDLSDLLRHAWEQSAPLT
jgi:hypothetical protein